MKWQETYQWYNEQQAGLGDLFLDELESYYDKLEALPLAYNKIRKNFRQAVLHKFPYVIVFEIIKKEVVIYSIFHTSRNPKKKFKKQ